MEKALFDKQSIHQVINQHLPIQDKFSKKQLEQRSAPCTKNSINLYELGHKYKGIVHVTTLTLGITKSEMAIVSSASPTTTYDTFGTIVFKIGTSRVAQVFSSPFLVLNNQNSLRLPINRS